MFVFVCVGDTGPEIQLVNGLCVCVWYVYGPEIQVVYCLLAHIFILFHFYESESLHDSLQANSVIVGVQGIHCGFGVPSQPQSDSQS